MAVKMTLDDTLYSMVTLLQSIVMKERSYSAHTFDVLPPGETPKYHSPLDLKDDELSDIQNPSFEDIYSHVRKFRGEQPKVDYRITDTYKWDFLGQGLNSFEVTSRDIKSDSYFINSVWSEETTPNITFNKKTREYIEIHIQKCNLGKTEWNCWLELDSINGDQGIISSRVVARVGDSYKSKPEKLDEYIHDAHDALSEESKGDVATKYGGERNILLVLKEMSQRLLLDSDDRPNESIFNAIKGFGDFAYYKNSGFKVIVYAPQYDLSDDIIFTGGPKANAEIAHTVNDIVMKGNYSAIFYVGGGDLSSEYQLLTDRYPNVVGIPLLPTGMDTLASMFANLQTRFNYPEQVVELLKTRFKTDDEVKALTLFAESDISKKKI
jgi:hypothetical protein